MSKTFRFLRIVSLALLLAVLVEFQGRGVPVQAQSGSAPSGPTAQDCFSARFHAATDCDRIASGTSVIQGAAVIQANVPVTGASLFGPGSKDCYSAKYHAASDCDRLASGQ
jgi:hypothetical protein